MNNIYIPEKYQHKPLIHAVSNKKIAILKSLKTQTRLCEMEFELVKIGYSSLIEIGVIAVLAIGSVAVLLL